MSTMIRIVIRIAIRTVTYISPDFPTHIPQAAAAAFIAGKPDIFTAARTGDISLVGHHVTAQPSCVNAKDWMYETHTLALFLKCFTKNLFCFHFQLFVTPSLLPAVGLH